MKLRALLDSLSHRETDQRFPQGPDSWRSQEAEKSMAQDLLPHRPAKKML